MANTNSPAEEMQLVTTPLAQPRMPSPFEMAIDELRLDALPFFYPLDALEKFLPRDSLAFLDAFLSGTALSSLKTWLTAPASGPGGATPGTTIFMICTLSLLASFNAPTVFTRFPCASQLQPANSCPLQKHYLKAVQLLYDYPAIIQKFLSHAPKGDPPPLVTSDAPNTLDALVTANERAQTQNVMDKTIANILLAALGLRLTMESFPIPDGWNELDSCGVPAEFVACFCRLKSPSVHSGPRLMLLPLHLALSISPILLLIPKSYINKSVSRAWLYKIWLHLGSERPEYIEKVERAIWVAVNDVARAPSALSSALFTLRADLKDLASTIISQEDQRFFQQLESIVVDSSSNASVAPTLPSPATAGSQPQSLTPVTPPQPSDPGDASAATSTPSTTTIVPSSPRPPSRSTSPPASAPIVTPDPGDASVATPAPSTTTIVPSSPRPPSRSTSPTSPSTPTAHQPHSNGPRSFNPPSDSPNDENNPRRIASIGPSSKHRKITVAGPARPSPSAGQKRKRANSSSGTSSPGEDDDIDPDGNGSDSVPDVFDASASHAQGTTPRVTRPKRTTTAINPSWFKVPRSTKKRRLCNDDDPSVSSNGCATPVKAIPSKSGEEPFHCDLPLVYDVRGKPVELKPLIYNHEHQKTLQALFQAMIETSANLPPQYTSSPKGRGLIIQSLDYKTYRCLSYRGLDSFLNTGPVVITHVPDHIQPKTFREAILSMERPLNTAVTCFDPSRPVGPNGSGQYWNSSLKELVRLSADPETNQPIYCQRLPGPLSSDLPIVHEDTIDRVCYRATWQNRDTRPAPDMSFLQWNSISSRWRFDPIKVHTSGFLSVILPVWGKMLYAILRRKDDPSGFRPINWNDATGILSSSQYDVDYAIIEPGTAMFIPAGCPHAILHLDGPTLVHGSLHYLGGNIVKHMFSFIHSLAIPRITDTSVYDYATPLTVVSRIVVMFQKFVDDKSVYSNRVTSHLPFFASSNSVQEYLIVCVVGRLLPWLFPQPEDADDAGAASSASSECLAQLGSHWALLDDNGAELDVYNDIYVPYLHHVCRVFISLTTLGRRRPLIGILTLLKPSLLSSVPEAEGFDTVSGWEDVDSLDDGRLDLRIQTRYTYGLQAAHMNVPSKMNVC